MDGHDGKELLHGPTVRHALEQREVAEVRVGKQPVQALQLLREIVELLGQLLNPAADLPVDALRQAALCQRQVSQAEQVERGVERLLRIVAVRAAAMRTATSSRSRSCDTPVTIIASR